MTNIALQRDRLIRSLIRRCRDEQGIGMMLSLVFMMTAGVTIFFVLWGVSYVTAVTTKVYGATQIAAYAAANEVNFINNPVASWQPSFDCRGNDLFDPSNPTPTCTSGPAVDTARLIMQEQLQGNPPGVVYRADGSGEVQLLDAGGNVTNGIIVYHVPLPAGAARAADPGCTGSAAVDGVATRTCWKNPRADAFTGNQANYTSGVVINARVTVPFVPGCGGISLCPVMTFDIAVPARVGQQNGNVNR